MDDWNPPDLRKLLRPLAGDDSAVAAAVLARVLAHEVGNGLNPMALQLELLRRRCAQDARACEVVQALRTAVDDLARVLDRIRALSEPVADGAADGAARAQVADDLAAALRS